MRMILLQLYIVYIFFQNLYAVYVGTFPIPLSVAIIVSDLESYIFITDSSIFW